MKFNLSTMVSAMRLAIAEHQERERIRLLVRHYWPKRHEPHQRFYLRHQLNRLRAMRRK